GIRGPCGPRHRRGLLRWAGASSFRSEPFPCVPLLPPRRWAPPRRGNPDILLPIWVSGSSQLPDSQQAAAGFDGMRQEFRNIEKKTNLLSVHWPLVAPRVLRCGSPTALGASATGSEHKPLDVSIMPGRLRETVLRPSRGGWAVRAPKSRSPESEGAM